MSSNNHASATIAAYEMRIEQLTGQVSELTEENNNLRLLDALVRRNNALFEALLANHAGGITLTGPDRRIVRVIRGLSAFTSADLIGVRIETLVVPEDQRLIVESYEQLLHRKRDKANLEIRVFNNDGSIMWFSVTLTDMLDDPNVQGIVWNYSDISQERRKERSPRMCRDPNVVTSSSE